MRGQPIPFEAYSDVVLFGQTAYTFNMVFGVSGGEGTKPLALIQMSPEHVKVLAILLKRVVKEWEERRQLPIAIPPALLEQRKINLEEDW
jgi:hypothetical protein